MTPTHFLGIDPGMTGGVALYVPNAVTESRVWRLPVAYDATDPIALASLIKLVRSMAIDPKALHVAIEHVHSRPRQAGAFNFGFSTGMIHAVLTLADQPFEIVASSKWKPAMGLQRTPDETYQHAKERSRQAAIKLFPHLKTDMKLKKDDGKAEALLLAVYAAHQASRKEVK